MAGSPENAVALATALRTGTAATLTYTSTSSTGETTQTAVEFANPTRPMGWGNVSHALAIAQFSLRQAGIENPTAADLQAALNGGTVTTADGKTVALTGVLQQRAAGMGWGQIAKTYGTTMGAVNRGLKSPSTTIASSAPTRAGPTTTAKTSGTAVTNGRTASGSTTTSGLKANNVAPGQVSKGITTATGATIKSSASVHSAKGITTASGAIAAGSTRVASAAGNSQGNAYGRGLVTAAGGGGSTSVAAGRGSVSGVVTGSGAGAATVTAAQPGSGMGQGSSRSNGKGGG
jgi:hypothetical protein